jgi:hypothetical protein
MKQFLYACFLFTIITVFAYYNSLHNVEHFTPGVRAFYRPIVRQTRIVGEGFYNKTSTNISNLFRKFGIM